MILVNILCWSGILMSYLALVLQFKEEFFSSDGYEIFKR
jgi:hypothetical protein